MLETATIKRQTQCKQAISTLLMLLLTACGGDDISTSQQKSSSLTDPVSSRTSMKVASENKQDISNQNTIESTADDVSQPPHESIQSPEKIKVTATVSQAVPLNLTVPDIIRVVATDNTGIAITAPAVVDWLNQARATGAVSINHNAPARLPIGQSDVTFTATDAQGKRVQKSTVIFVVQVTAPVEPTPPTILPPLTTKTRPVIDTSFIPSTSQKSYTLELSRWNIKNNGDESYAVANTDAMQNAIDWASENGYDSIKVPAGNYLIGKYGNAVYQAGISLPSNMVFELDKDATIEMHTNDKWNYCLVDVREKTNVVIRGGSLKGDRDSHIFTPSSKGGTAHDEGHLICVQHESENVLIENMTLTHATGDGILLVGHKGPGSSVKNIIIRNNDMNNNRRQGVSIVGGSNVLVEDNEIHHINGISPQFGLDIESVIYKSDGIIIRRNNFHHNRGGDIVNVDGSNVWIENNTMHQGEGNRYIDGPIVWHRHVDMHILNNDITMLTNSVNFWWGMISYASEFSTKNTATTYIENNTCNSCGIYTRFHHGLVVRNNRIKSLPIFLRFIKHLQLEDNVLTEKGWYKANYRLKAVAGSASGNTLDGVLEDIQLTDVASDYNLDGGDWK